MKKIMSANEWINYTALFDLPMIIVFSDRDQEIMFKWHFRFLVSLYKKRRCGLLFYHGIIILCEQPFHLCGISCDDRHHPFVKRFVEKNAMKTYLFYCTNRKISTKCC